jgi:hypothetical protein
LFNPSRRDAVFTTLPKAVKSILLPPPTSPTMAVPVSMPMRVRPSASAAASVVLR